MLLYRANVICTMIICSLILFASCGQPTASPTATGAEASSHPYTPALPTATVVPTSSSVSSPPPAPQQYASHVILSGAVRPDDLAFDQQGRLLFSDSYKGTVSRINAHGSITTILSGLAGPEGLVVLSDGTLIIAEQRTNRILSLAPGANSPTVLRALPGTPSAKPCKDGVDGIAFDATTQTLIIPDSPTGNVYRMSLDGKTLTLLASGIVRPVGAAVDAQGTIYVADECGGALWRITRDGKTMRIGGFGMPDDVAFDQHGNILIIDLKPSIHSLIRMNLATGDRETLASQGFIEPQGLVIDSHDDIFVSDDYANIIVEYIPT
jgi:streptogramin lyase